MRNSHFVSIHLWTFEETYWIWLKGLQESITLRNFRLHYSYKSSVIVVDPWHSCGRRIYSAVLFLLNCTKTTTQTKTSPYKQNTFQINVSTERNTSYPELQLFKHTKLEEWTSKTYLTKKQPKILLLVS